MIDKDTTDEVWDIYKWLLFFILIALKLHINTPRHCCCSSPLINKHLFIADPHMKYKGKNRGSLWSEITP